MGALDELLAQYLPRARARLGRLAELLAAGDIDGAIATAHAIAGTAGSYGLAPLSAEARAVELSLEEGTPPAEHIDGVRAMLASLPDAPVLERRSKIIVLGEATGADVLSTPSPRVAFEWAMDEPPLAVVVDYRRGRSLLRSLASLESMGGVPIVLTGVDEESAERARARTGACATFPGAVDDEVLARVRELAS